MVELCQLTHMPFSDAARLILAVRGGVGVGGTGTGWQGAGAGISSGGVGSSSALVAGGGGDGGGAVAGQQMQQQQQLGAMAQRLAALEGGVARVLEVCERTFSTSEEKHTRQLRGMETKMTALESKLDTVLAALEQTGGVGTSISGQHQHQHQQQQGVGGLQQPQVGMIDGRGSPVSPVAAWAAGGGVHYGQTSSSPLPMMSPAPQPHQPWVSGVPPTPRGIGVEEEDIDVMPESAAAQAGRCTVDPGFEQLTPRSLSSVETKMRRIAFKLCFQLQPAPLHPGGSCTGTQTHWHL